MNNIKKYLHLKFNLNAPIKLLNLPALVDGYLMEYNIKIFTILRSKIYTFNEI